MKWFLATIKAEVKTSDIGWSGRDAIQIIRGSKATLGYGVYLSVARAANGSDWIGIDHSGRIIRFSKAAAVRHLACMRDDEGRPVPETCGAARETWAGHRAHVAKSQAYSGE